MTARTSPCLLAGDLGGTKTILSLFTSADGDELTLHESTFASREFSNFTALVAQFLSTAPREAVQNLRHACFAIAGPVSGDSNHQFSKITNLDWQLDSRALATALNLERVVLINDFEAVGHGIAALPSSNLAVLQDGMVEKGAPRIVLGAGTGLGVCQIIPQEHGSAVVIPSEGGHIDFAPTSELEVELLRFMWRRFPHVSYDRIVSGSGLVALFTFLVERESRLDDLSLASMLDEQHGAAIISQAYDSEPLARAAIDWFVRVYGAQAGNLALINLAYGGVYITGGIAPKMLHHLQKGSFITSFRNKGRMQPLLERMRVNVVLCPKVGLRGAQRVLQTFN